MLELQNLSITQDDFSLTANLAIEARSRTAIIGPSGAGKSTLLSLIAGFLFPDTGKILWEGGDLTILTPGERPISMLFQDQNLFPHLSVGQNVGLGLRPDLRLSPDQKQQITVVLEKVGLPGMEDRKPASLSGGQQSRVALARVLLQNRPILLLDEPFAALGPALKSEMLSLVAQIAADMGTTVLIVTHDPEDAQSFAPQTIVVDQGIASPPTSTTRLLSDPPASLRDYLGSPVLR